MGIDQDAKRFHQDYGLPVTPCLPLERLAAEHYRFRITRNLDARLLKRLEQVMPMLRSKTYRDLVQWYARGLSQQEEQHVGSTIGLEVTGSPEDRRLPPVRFTDFVQPSDFNIPFLERMVETMHQVDRNAWKSFVVPAVAGGGSGGGGGGKRSRIAPPSGSDGGDPFSSCSLASGTTTSTSDGASGSGGAGSSLAPPPVLLVPNLKPERSSLSYLTEQYLGVELKKPRRIIMSNWEQYPLDDRQLEYAAKDAEAGLQILESAMTAWLGQDVQFQTRQQLFLHLERFLTPASNGMHH